MYYKQGKQLKLIKLTATNYRNLDSINIDLNENCNFIVGENNLGKSNLLDLFQIIFSNRSFVQTDFTAIDQSIVAELTIKLDDIEIGNFEDLFDAVSTNTINIICKQETVDDNIEFFHKETQIYIPASRIRGANFIHYNSLRNPIQEVKFGKSKGVGRFLNNIVQKYLKDNSLQNSDFIHEDKIADLLSFVNENITKIKTFSDFNINAVSDKELESLLPKLLVFEDGNNNPLSQTGYGIQFLILITLSILEKVENIISKHASNTIFETSDGKKYISLIIGLDEPEVHLHPYMQRSLIKYLNKIITNENTEFSTLLKDLFDLDGFIGQIILVTHSPNILLNDYRQVIRFHKENTVTKITSGSAFVLNSQESKHLHLLFPFIKEAFFSRGVILVEGDSEYGSFPFFAYTLDYDFDDLGICLIQTRGEGGIKPAITLLSKFLIPSVAIRDKDNITEPSIFPIYLTDKIDYEEELIETNFANYIVLEKIFFDFDSKQENTQMQAGALKKRAYKAYKTYTSEPTFNLTYKEINDPVDRKAFYLTWYSINKSITLGMLIGQTLEVNQIPQIYKTVIEKIVELTANE